MRQVRLGRVQMRIMKVLWARGSASAREVTEALATDGAGGGSEPLAHSTVQTLLRKLEDKGAVRHEVGGDEGGSRRGTFVFFPAVDDRSVTRGVTRDLIERVFGGSAAGLVAHLLKEERISAKELGTIRAMVDAAARARKGKGTS